MKWLFNFFLAILIFFTSLPINYFFENNFNFLPIQLIIILLISRLFFSINLKHILIISISIMALFLAGNIEFNQVFSSSITATFVTIWFILFSKKIKFKIKDLNKIISILFLIMTVFVAYFNLDFFLSSDLNIRSKAFGSGSLFSIISLYGFTFLMVIYNMKLINKFFFYPILIVFFTSALLTQVRGVMLTMIVVYILLEFENLKSWKWSRLLLITSLGVLLIVNSSILNRFNIDNTADVNQLTSGRYATQLLIIESVFITSDNMTFLFGHGLNSIKQNLQPIGLEFPHLDVLFLLYEGGLILLIIYIILMYRIYKSYKYKLLFWIFIISSLHTNMILSPGFLFLGFLLDKSIVVRTQNNVRHRV